MQIWGESNVGMIRKENQDAWQALEAMPSGYQACVVCDGMGGPAGGRMASKIAVETYLAQLKTNLRQDMKPEEIGTASAQAVSAANQAIRTAAEENPQYRNMGTTLVSAVVRGDQAVITNVGDSRAYRIDPEGIRRVTRDHSLVQNMVDHGEITPEEARRHPKRNLITRALGPDEDVKSDVYQETLPPGAYLLLCTDGLTNVVTDQEILFEVLHENGPEGCPERLIEIVRRRGAPDNVTVVLMRQEGQEGGT